MDHTKKILSLLLGLTLLMEYQFASAEFPLNWKRVSNPTPNAAPNINCNRGEGSINCGRGTGADNDTTPFLQELVKDANNRSYYHVIIGDPSNGGFAQEVYIQASGARWQGGTGSASGGTVDFSIDQYPLAAANLSGNGTGNPTQVIMRQVLDDKEMHQEFIKDGFAFKPKISQDISNAELQMKFEADMRRMSLTDMSTPVPVINQLALADAMLGNFDMIFNPPGNNATAGQYRWLPGNGPAQSSGTYDYADASAFDPAVVDWVFYRDPAQNPPSKAVP